MSTRIKLLRGVNIGCKARPELVFPWSYDIGWLGRRTADGDVNSDSHSGAVGSSGTLSRIPPATRARGAVLTNIRGDWRSNGAPTGREPCGVEHEYTNIHWENLGKRRPKSHLEKLLVSTVAGRRSDQLHQLYGEIEKRLWMAHSSGTVDLLVGSPELGSRTLCLQAAALPFSLKSKSEDRACLASLDLTRKVVETVCTVTGGQASAVQQHVHPDSRGLTALMVAASSNTSAALNECLSLVLGSASYISSEIAAAWVSRVTVDGFSALAAAAISGHRTNMRALLSVSKNYLSDRQLWDLLVARNANGASVLNHAATFSHPLALTFLLRTISEVAPSLVEHKNLLLATTNSGFSVLHHAALSSSTASVREIQKHILSVCDVDALDDLHQSTAQSIDLTPLEMAVLTGAPSEVIALLASPESVSVVLPPAARVSVRLNRCDAHESLQDELHRATSIGAALRRSDVNAAEIICESMDEEYRFKVFEHNAETLLMSALSGSALAFAWWREQMTRADVNQSTVIGLLLKECPHTKSSALSAFAQNWVEKGSTLEDGREQVESGWTSLFDAVESALYCLCTSEVDGTLRLHCAAKELLRQSLRDEIALLFTAAAQSRNVALLRALVQFAIEDFKGKQDCLKVPSSLIHTVIDGEVVISSECNALSHTAVTNRDVKSKAQVKLELILQAYWADSVQHRNALSSRDTFGRTPLDHAVEARNDEMVVKLCEHLKSLKQSEFTRSILFPEKAGTPTILHRVFKPRETSGQPHDDKSRGARLSVETLSTLKGLLISLLSPQDLGELLKLTDMRGYCALHDAAQSGEKGSVAWLSELAEWGLPKADERQAWFSARSSHGFSVLQKALQADRGHAAVSEYLDVVWSAPLLDRKVLVDIMLRPNRDGWTPLHAAAISRDLDASCVFLDRLCDIKFTEDELRCAFLGKTRRAQSVLHLAVEHTPNESGASVLRRLLYMMKHETTFSQDDWGDILGSSNVSGNGLLHAALRGSNIDVFRLVLETVREANLSRDVLVKLFTAKNDAGFTPLHQATVSSWPASIVRALTSAVAELGEDIIIDVLTSVTNNGLLAERVSKVAARHDHPERAEIDRHLAQVRTEAHRRVQERF